MVDANILEKDAINFAKLAVEHDRVGKFDVAVFYYTEAAQALLAASMAGSKKENILTKASEYISRAEELKSHLTPQNSLGSAGEHLSIEEQSTTQVGAERAQYILTEAMQLDESRCYDDAITRYTEAVELLLQVRKSTPDKATQDRLGKLASNALDRAETLKELRRSGSLINNLPTPPETDDIPSAPPLHPSPRHHMPTTTTATSSSSPNDTASNQTPQLTAPRGEAYTSEELKVLRVTSNINERLYVPFLQHVDLRQERFAFPIPFTDKDGLLALSSQQQKHLQRWVRPGDFTTDPKMILAVSSFSIRQTIVTDCSFVASMAIAAQYERRFNKRLVTNIIYPQNKSGEAIYNPCGKYMVKLHINGVPRKVIIDDLLPMGHDGELLCSYSTNRNELWVSLLEKSYMKVMGGYDFPGSNSNIDLHALTGWIPERLPIRSGSLSFNKDKEFRRLMKKFHQGHCLVTVATGEIKQADADRAGLVPTHAYAMLDIREVDGIRLFMLKNPWSHLRWRGNYSERDTDHWTPKLQKALNYDLNSAQLVDNGVFWIDYDSLCHFFDVIYINWNPSLFPFTTCVHSSWVAGDGPRKDVYSIRDNPQYRLWCRQGNAVWILLTRHITDKEDFANNREFMAVVVYRGIKTKRVYYPSDPQPYRDGVRINSPHNLVKLVLDELTADTAVNGWQCLNLVVSQWEKQNTLHYTLRVFSSAEVRLQNIQDPYTHVERVSGRWQGRSAGGCGNHPETYANNPTYQININNNRIDNCLLLELKGPKDYAVGFEIVTVTANNGTASNSFKRLGCGPYRRGYVVLEVDNISGGVYNIIVSTYNPGEECPFVLIVNSVHKFTLNKI